jgi:GT2 family glycosyltransferase
VIVISFNTKEMLRACMRSIQSSIHDLAYEVIVVDNDSKDRSAEMIAEEFSAVSLRLNNENVGFAKANNQAMKIARGRYMLLLNSDAELEKGTAEKLVAFMDARPLAGVAGPKVLNFDGSLQSKGFHFPSVAYSMLTLLKLHRAVPRRLLPSLFPSFYWGENDRRQVDWVSGCCMLIRADVIQRIGGLSEDFFMYGEDFEFCFRVNKNGLEVWYVPDAEARHLNRGSAVNNRIETMGRSQILLYEKTLGVARGIIISFLTILSYVIKLTYQALQYLVTRKRVQAEVIGGLREEFYFFRLLLRRGQRETHE